MIGTVVAPNPSAMTLDGTRTFIIGERHVAIIDPGPAALPHIDAIVATVHGGADAASLDPVPGPATRPAGGSSGVAFHAVILLTHTHPDHAAGAAILADRLGAETRAVALGNLREGDTVGTDAGALVTLRTPGHTPDHVSFWLEAERTVFCGDLMMGGLDTALVAPPEGNLRAYLESLERLRSLGPVRILPAHGPPFEDADTAIDRYIEHRRTRCAQVATALRNAPPLTAREVADRVYGGEVPEDLREIAVSAVVAYLEYLREDGSVVGTGDRWQAVR